MANFNRTTVKEKLDTALQPVLTLPVHLNAIKNDFAEQCKFRNEKILSVIASGGVASLDFTNTEVILLNCGQEDCIATIVETGINTNTFYVIAQEKGTNFSISNATDITPDPDIVKADNYVVYRISKYGVHLKYEALEKTMYKANQAEVQDGTLETKYVTPYSLNGLIEASEGMSVYNTGWSGDLSFTKFLYRFVHVQGYIDYAGGGNNIAGIVKVKYRPINEIYAPISYNDAGVNRAARFLTNGNLIIEDTINTNLINTVYLTS